MNPQSSTLCTHSFLSGRWLILAAAVLWGTTGTSQALAPTGAQPAVIGTIRLVIGGLALLLLALARRPFRSGRPERSWPVGATLVAGGSMALYQLCFFAGVLRAGVAVGTIAAIGSAPVLAGALAFLVRKERPGRRWAVATFLAVAGCALLISGGDGRSDAPTGVIGILLAMGAGAAYATYTVASKGLVEGRPPDVAMAAVFCLGGLFLAPLLFIADLAWLAEPRGLAVVTTAVAYSLFARGLAAMPVATAVTLTLAEPLTAGLLGIVVLGERLTLVGIIGIALLLAGLALLRK